MVAVLVIDGVDECRRVAGRQHDPGGFLPAPVAAECLAAADLSECLGRHDSERHPLDLRPVSRVAQELGIPLDVDLLGLDVEGDRPAGAISAGPELGGRDRRADEGRENDEEQGQPAHEVDGNPELQRGDEQSVARVLTERRYFAEMYSVRYWSW